MTGLQHFGTAENPVRSRSARMQLALLGLGVMALLAGCASLPPGSDFPKTSSSALARPEQTRMGRQLATGKAEHPGNSGFKLLPVGTDSFLLRMEMAQAAERTLDVQHFLIQSAATGQLLIEALLLASDRGVRVRVLLDDAGSFGRDAQVRTLAGYPNIQLRLFNPFAYRGNVGFVHGAEFFADATRLNYRMHNKLFVVDNEISIVGGRNIGDEYFQGGRDYEFGDYDVIAAGPIVNDVSKSFDAFWNSPLAIPIEALAEGKPSAQDLEDYRGVLAAHHANMIEADAPYMRTLAANQPLTAMLDGKSSLSWARGDVYDSPEKAKVQDGEQGGRFLRHRLGEVAKQVQTELIIVSPYLVPGTTGMQFLTGLRERNVSVRILTNSLASTDMPVVHSSYQAVRAPLLGTGVDLYEMRPVLGAPVVRGTRLRSLSSGGQYALHAKVFVFDRERVFVGSMNLDQRSLHLNTEIGLIIDSPELARQIASRFADITQPANSYVLVLSEVDGFGQRHLVWRTVENGMRVDFDQEPNVTFWQRLQIDMLSMLPLDGLL